MLINIQKTSRFFTIFLSIIIALSILAVNSVSAQSCTGVTTGLTGSCLPITSCGDDPGDTRGVIDGNCGILQQCCVPCGLSGMQCCPPGPAHCSSSHPELSCISGTCTEKCNSSDCLPNTPCLTFSIEDGSESASCNSRINFNLYQLNTQNNYELRLNCAFAPQTCGSYPNVFVENIEGTNSTISTYSVFNVNNMCSYSSQVVYNSSYTPYIVERDLSGGGATPYPVRSTCGNLSFINPAPTPLPECYGCFYYDNISHPEDDKCYQQCQHDFFSHNIGEMCIDTFGHYYGCCSDGFSCELFPTPAVGPCPDLYSCSSLSESQCLAVPGGIERYCLLPSGATGQCCEPDTQINCLPSCNPIQNPQGCYSCSSGQVSNPTCVSAAGVPYGNMGSCSPLNGYQYSCPYYPCCLTSNTLCGIVSQWPNASCCPGTSCMKVRTGSGSIDVTNLPCPGDLHALSSGESCMCAPPAQPPPGGPYYCSYNPSFCECNCPAGWTPADPFCTSYAESSCSLHQCGCTPPRESCTSSSGQQGMCYFLTCPPKTSWTGIKIPDWLHVTAPIPSADCPDLYACCVTQQTRMVTRLKLMEACQNGQTGINTAIGCIVVNNQIDLLKFILPWAIGVGGGTAFILIIVAGFLVMTSAGDPGRAKAGKDLLGSAIAGLLMIIFSVYILDFIGLRILRIPGL